MIPEFQQDLVNARMRRCKWLILHNKNVVAGDLIRARFISFNYDEERLTVLTNLLIEEVK